MRQLARLAFDHVVSLALQRRFILVEAQQMHGTANRGEGIAQFVAEHRQKLILAVV